MPLFKEGLCIRDRDRKDSSTNYDCGKDTIGITCKANVVVQTLYLQGVFKAIEYAF